MYQVNPYQLVQMIKGGQNPQQLMLNVLSQSEIAGTPMGKNLINLARNGNTAEIEKIARNIAKQKGMDFDKEFNAFRQNLGL